MQKSYQWHCFFKLYHLSTNLNTEQYFQNAEYKTTLFYSQKLGKDENMESLTFQYFRTDNQLNTSYSKYCFPGLEGQWYYNASFSGKEINLTGA